MPDPAEPENEPDDHEPERPPPAVVEESPGPAAPDPSGMWLVTAVGELDLDTIGGLRADLEEAAERYPVVLLDLSQVPFGDSSFLNLLIRVRLTTDLRLVAPTEPLRQLFALTGTDEVLQVYATVDEAIEG
ncbi:STAS domain-containing protein [Streptomyces sp. NPDC007088]|uniref:STAS domain-containing protein n=1 Tax=Streptomyces sp. NPDC007088 TaxID=3364773 RepID=UPI0036C90C12